MRITARAVLAAVIVSAMGFFSVVVSAQQPSAQKQPSAGALAAARQLLELKGAYSVYTGAVPGTVDSIKVQLIQANISYQKDLNEIAAKLRTDLNGRDAELGNEMARQYATDFSEQELKDIVAFYKTPLGKKMLDQEPKTIAASLQFMRDWGARFADEVDGKFHQEMKSRGKPLN
jgi:hypothetical protein